MVTKCSLSVSWARTSLGILVVVLLGAASSMPTPTTGFNGTINTTVITTVTSMSFAASTSQSRVADCSLKAQRVATGLGSIILVETLFCCFVLYRWVKKHRLALNLYNTDNPAF